MPAAIEDMDGIFYYGEADVEWVLVDAQFTVVVDSGQNAIFYASDIRSTNERKPVERVGKIAADDKSA